MKGVDSQHTTFVGEIIRDAVFQNPDPNAIDVYTPMIKKDNFVMIKLKQVLTTGQKIKRIDEKICYQVHATRNKQKIQMH